MGRAALVMQGEGTRANVALEAVAWVSSSTAADRQTIKSSLVLMQNPKINQGRARRSGNENC